MLFHLNTQSVAKQSQRMPTEALRFILPQMASPQIVTKVFRTWGCASEAKKQGEVLWMVHSVF